MAATTVLSHGELRVVDYRCDAGPHSTPFVEVHGGHSLSFVRRGSFGYQTRGQRYELVAGAVLIGHPGDEFVCTHEHHGCALAARLPPCRTRRAQDPPRSPAPALSTVRRGCAATMRRPITPPSSSIPMATTSKRCA